MCKNQASLIYGPRLAPLGPRAAVQAGSAPFWFQRHFEEGIVDELPDQHEKCEGGQSGLALETGAVFTQRDCLPVMKLLAHSE